MKKYENFSKALSNLHEGVLLEEPYTVVEQAGIIGLFFICFEQSWKLIKDILEKHGRFDGNIGSPRAIIKIAFQCHMIDDGGLWLEILEARNILAHTYSDEQSITIIRRLKEKYIIAFDRLQAVILEAWQSDT